ncbi:SpoIIE family protein phosphatase, partial [bacterium]|nr:SpoIIE family protein phosphatase [bacterium]
DLFRSMDLGQVSQPVVWFLLPRFLHALLKMYLLAVLIKIPVVLVYNFAKLSGKLRISGLFQSTFPQIIQLVMLLIIFYFFIAGWQAEKVRQALVSQTEQISSGANGHNLVALKTALHSNTIVHLDGYERIRAPAALPSHGILSLLQDARQERHASSEMDYFFFTRSSRSDSLDFFHLVRVDSAFLGMVAENAQVLAASTLLGYPYDPPNWESFILQATFFDRNESFRIFPFGLAPSEERLRLRARFPEAMADFSSDSEITADLLIGNQFSVGRIIAPVYNADGTRRRFFAFDILFAPNLSFFTSTLSSYLLLLIMVYGLVNIVVIRRIVKFGSEINRMIVQKFNQLTKGIRQIASGNLDYKVKVDGEDEFVELAERFNQMGDKLKESIAEARERERLQQELTIARKVQLDMLPKTLPDIPGFKIAATLQTVNTVGGDFYDIVSLDKDRFLFTIGDVSGKSTSAAFYMAQCISLFRYSQQFTLQPMEIAVRLNRYFSDPMVDRHIFVTAIVGLLDVKRSELRLVRAGHPMPLLIPGNAAKEIVEKRSKGLGIGLERAGELFEKNLEDIHFRLNAADAVVFYTDGVVEASTGSFATDGVEKEDTVFYGEERFLELLHDMRGKDSKEILNRVIGELDAFYNGTSPVDDYTLLVIQKR